jgi:hypothetical protein
MSGKIRERIDYMPDLLAMLWKAFYAETTFASPMVFKEALDFNNKNDNNF